MGVLDRRGGAIGVDEATSRLVYAFVRDGARGDGDLLRYVDCKGGDGLALERRESICLKAMASMS